MSAGARRLAFAIRPGDAGGEIARFTVAVLVSSISSPVVAGDLPCTRADVEALADEARAFLSEPTCLLAGDETKSDALTPTPSGSVSTAKKR